MMKKIIRYFILFSLFTIILATSLIYASGPNMIGICNVTNGELKCGSFEMNGVILNNGQISRVAVKVGIGPWENASGVDRFRYPVNTRHIVLGYENTLNPATAYYGPYYGDLSIVIGAFDANDNKVAEKTVNVTIVPEKPSSDIISGVYSEPVNVILKAAPEVMAYYTIDGTDPKINGTSYTGAIYVSQNTVIKAVSKSTNNQYSETTILDLKINNSNPPGFVIQYYEDQALTCPVPDPAYLKTGTYYLKIVSDRKFSSGPYVDIDTPGSGNDVNHENLVPVSDCVYRYTRAVYDDLAATGDAREAITISGTDSHGNSVQNIIPTNSTAKAAYLDTQPPASGSIALAAGASTSNDPTPVLDIHSTGAARMRLALSETGLASALWVEYAAQYDEFDISGGGNGSKTIWIEFMDRAGNIQTQHASTTVSYDNAILSFDVEYFSDSGLAQSLGNNPYLKEGTYYLKITANQDLSYNPSLQINAEGTNNDVANGLTIMVNSRIFYYMRTIAADSAAIGTTREQITIQGINPSNAGSKAAYTDTRAPGIPYVYGSETTANLKPTWYWFNVNDATRYRYSFSDGSNWEETTATSFTPADNLGQGNRYTLYVQAGDRAGNWSSSGSFTITISSPEINVKQGTTVLPNGTGSFDFGNVAVLSSKNIYFLIENNGDGELTLTDSPIVRFSGADASCFRLTSSPYGSWIGPGETASFAILFQPDGLGVKTATVSIANSDTDRNPYTFTITGTGVAENFALDTWIPGNLATDYDTKIYYINATAGQTYAISWDDRRQGSGNYTGDIGVQAYRQDLTTRYFSEDSGYTSPKVITAQENIIYLKVFTSYLPGSYALKACLNGPAIKVQQGTNEIPNGTGSYNYGNTPLCNGSNATFTVQNTGSLVLALTTTPQVQISGPDASCFSVTAQPASTVALNSSTTFTVQFTPTTAGTKTATVSIGNNTADKNPYTFTITGTAILDGVLTQDSWTSGNITTPGEVKVYSFNAVVGKNYGITWDDSAQGSGTYNGNIKVSAYRANTTPAYFTDVDSGYSYPAYANAKDSIIYIKVTGIDSAATGSFALKAALYEPVINVKQGTTDLPNGTGNYDFGNVFLGAVQEATFIIQNTGTTSLNLTNTPIVQISGANAASFSITAQPYYYITPNDSTAFTIRFAPASTGTKTATVSIANTDIDRSPYIFTITGTGIGTAQALTLGAWTSGNIAVTGEVKTYSFNAVPGNNYVVAWADSAQGTGSHTANIKVTAYRQDLSTAYFSEIDSGYTTPRIITAQDNIIYLKVAPFYQSSTGSFAVKAALPEPAINVKQGNTDLPNGTGNYNFGNIPAGSSTNTTFTIQNTGTSDLNLTNNPKVRITGTDASCFNITAEPASPVPFNGNTTFTVCFTPDVSGTKAAVVSIASDDADKDPYTFTITGTGIGVAGTLTPGEWTSGTMDTLGEVKTYCFYTPIGNTYTITWDDSMEGSEIHTADVVVSAYRQDLTTAYFSNINSGYATPQLITAQDSIVYLKVTGSTGSFALKTAFNEPAMEIPSYPNGTGIYDFGNIAAYSKSNDIYFTIRNNGAGNLYFGTPAVRITGADAASFKVISQPSSSIEANHSSGFTVAFIPTSTGTKTATISIAGNDPAHNPYTFTVTGTGTGTLTTLALDTWNPGNITTGETKIYCFNAIAGRRYYLFWDDVAQGSGSYTGDIKVSAYRPDFITHYFSDVDSGYSSQIVNALDDLVYLKVTGINTSGSYALKVYLSEPNIIEPKISVKQGTTDIPNGGSYNFGSVNLGASASVAFTIKNSSDSLSLKLTDDPIVQITGSDASYFTVTAQASSPVAQLGSTTFTVKFTPMPVTGTATATVRIANNDSDMNPYTFTITGTCSGVITGLNLGEWISGNITAGQVKIYRFDTTVGKSYAITWDDNSQGSGSYSGNIHVSAYRYDFVTPYFTDKDSGYSTPQVFTAQDSSVYIKVVGDNLGPFRLKAYFNESWIIVSEYGGYNFGNMPLSTSGSKTFTIDNAGGINLNLTDYPRVRISGADSSCFILTTDASTPVAPGGSTSFTVRFTPTSPGVKTATISIANNDADKNPYTFTITGTGTGEIQPITLGTWNPGTISAAGESKLYSFSAIPGKSYIISWDDSYQGSGNYTCDTKVSAYRQDLFTPYFTDYDSGYTTLRIVTALENIVVIKVAGVSASTTGSYALKVSETEPVIGVKQGSNEIPNGTGNYAFGSIIQGSSSDATFSVLNTGTCNLNLTNTPKVTISGDGASSFSVAVEPITPIAPNGNTTFKIRFTPVSPGVKTATVSITNDDTDRSPYTFTVTGTGTSGLLTLGTWITGNITTVGETQLYSFNTTPGSRYDLVWDDYSEGSGAYSGNVTVSVFSLTTTYFNDRDSAFWYPNKLIAWDNIMYVKVTGTRTGGFALKASLDGPMIHVKQETANILNGTGRCDFGSVISGTYCYKIFTVQNVGGVSLNLTDTPKIQISGTDAACFSVTTQPSSPVAADGSTSFTVRFLPLSPGTKTATVSIASNDPEKNPFTFTVTGTATGQITALTPGAWTSGSISTSGEVKMYRVDVTPETSYAVSWDDSYQGSGSYSLNIEVSAYRQDLTTAYFTGMDSGYANPRLITALDNVIYIKVAAYSYTATGSFAVKAALSKPVINVKQGTTNIPNGSGNYNFGNVLQGANANATFTIQNTGVLGLNLTDTPKVRISGVDAGCFSVTADPVSPVAINGGTTTFTVRFTPDSTGTKTALLSIANDDSGNNPYTFTIIGAGAPLEPVINVKQGTTDIPNGTGSYNIGGVSVGSNSSVTFTIQNIGGVNLNITDSPRIRVSGTDALCFSVTAQPASPVAPGGSTTFTVKFTPDSNGTKNAVISIVNDDIDNSPYTFTITGTGTGATGELLTLGTWIPKSLSSAGQTNTYYFIAIPGKTYNIYWDDSYQGSGSYTCDVKVSGYRQNLTTTYFMNIDTGYSTPRTITAQEGIVYIKVAGYYSYSAGNFALKIVQVD
jgi:hypothetical protein